MLNDAPALHHYPTVRHFRIVQSTSDNQLSGIPEQFSQEGR